MKVLYNLTKAILFTGIFSVVNCGDTAILKEPSFRIQTGRMENMNTAPILHSKTSDSCEVILEKRFYHVLFVLPMNSFSASDIEKLQKAKSVRYKTVMNIGDILWTTLGFLGSFITETVEVEECKTNLLIVSPSDLNKPAEEKVDIESIRENERLKNEVARLERELKERNKPEARAAEPVVTVDENVIEIPDIPILTGYSQYIKHSLNPKSQDYLVVFETNKKTLSDDDLKKVKKFAKNYKENYSKYKILLIGHADWKGKSSANVTLSLERVKEVKEKLIEYGISDEKIFTTASGSYWPGNNEEKSGKEFNRRVDMLFLE